MIENYLSLPLKSVSPSSTRFSSNTIFLNTDLRSSCQPPSGSLGINDEVSAAGYSDAIAEGGQSKEDVEIGDVESASYETAALLLVVNVSFVLLSVFLGVDLNEFISSFRL